MSEVHSETMLYSGVTPNQVNTNPHSCTGVEDFKWHQESVMLLISLYRAKKTEFVSGFVKKRDLWSQVASEMSAQGYVVNFIACEKKWHNLCATYRKLKECSMKKRTCWPYFQPLQELLENNFDIQGSTLNGDCQLGNENNCNVVKVESSNLNETSNYGMNSWPPSYNHSQIRNSPSEGESGSCDHDISNMLSVTIEESLERSQASRDNLHISASSSYIHGNPDDFKWTHDSVMLLCSLYLARKEQFLSGAVKKRDLWTDIAQEMNRDGFSVTCIACEKKWHNLIATYKKVTMYSRKKTWPYLRIFQKIIEEQTMRAAVSGLSEHCHLSHGYSKDFSENRISHKYFDKDEALHSSENGMYGEPMNHNSGLIAEDFKWTHASVISLCTLYRQKRHEFLSNTVRKRDLWMDVASEMNSQGFNVTWVHCEKKWYNLYATYKKVTDHNRKRVRVWSTWPYLKLFQDIFSSSDSEPVQPLSISVQQHKCDNDSSTPCSACSPVSPNSNHSPETMHLPNDYQHSTKKQCISYAPEWFLDYCKQQKELEEKRQEEAERRHQELLRAINIGNGALLELSSSLKSFLNKDV